MLARQFKNYSIHLTKRDQAIRADLARRDACYSLVISTAAITWNTFLSDDIILSSVADDLGVKRDRRKR